MSIKSMISPVPFNRNQAANSDELTALLVLINRLLRNAEKHRFKRLKGEIILHLLLRYQLVQGSKRFAFIDERNILDGSVRIIADVHQKLAVVFRYPPLNFHNGSVKQAGDKHHIVGAHFQNFVPHRHGCQHHERQGKQKCVRVSVMRQVIKNAFCHVDIDGFENAD